MDSLSRKRAEVKTLLIPLFSAWALLEARKQKCLEVPGRGVVPSRLVGALAALATQLFVGSQKRERRNASYALGGVLLGILVERLLSQRCPKHRSLEV
ncbi:hypothetical protein H8D30_05220 [bacterium]|nr:hypothetical protein [bacterium]